MADYTASKAKFNAGVDLTLNDATASQTIGIDDVGDERALLIVQNNNESAAAYTATITIAAGDFLANALGDLSVDVADGGAIKVIGPLEGARFKTTGSKITVGVAVTQSGTVSDVSLGIVKLP